MDTVVRAGNLRCNTTVVSTGGRIVNLVYDPDNKSVEITTKNPDEVFTLPYEKTLEVRR